MSTFTLYVSVWDLGGHAGGASEVQHCMDGEVFLPLGWGIERSAGTWTFWASCCVSGAAVRDHIHRGEKGGWPTCQLHFVLQFVGKRVLLRLNPVQWACSSLGWFVAQASVSISTEPWRKTMPLKMLESLDVCAPASVCSHRRCCIVITWCSVEEYISIKTASRATKL